jgi:predicted dehydrogenase
MSETNGQFSVGLIGCGGHGRHLSGHLVTIPNTSIAGVQDVSLEAAHSAADELGSTAVATVEALLDLPGLNGVVIACPQFAHKELALKAAAAGKHIFVEKPMAMTTADCDEMLAAADAAGVKLAVGQVLRLVAPYRRMRELIESESLGEPRGVVIARSGGRKLDHCWKEAWRKDVNLCGGLLFEVHVHELDLMRAICGEPESVYAQGITVVEDDLTYDDLWFVQVRFKGGAGGMLHGGMGCYVGHQFVTIQCQHGTVSNHNEAREVLCVKTDETTQRFTLEEAGDHENGSRYELRSWVEAARDGTEMVVNGFDGRQAVAMAEAAVRSSESNEVVAVG